MQSRNFTLSNESGLHARPAALFVRSANSYKAKILISNLTNKTGPVDGKKILAVLSLGVMQNHRIRIDVKGKDESAAMEALEKLIFRNFQETD